MSKLKVFLLASLIIMITTSCSRYAMVSFNYPLPPEVSLPEDVKTIAVVNRSLIEQEDKPGKVLEAIISGEIEVSDKKASEQAIIGAYDRITNENLFKCVIPVEHQIAGSGTREVPLPLQWKLVNSICKASQAQALLSLEVFDSNSDLLVPKVIVPGNYPDNERTFNIVMLWKMYYPVEEKIIDQYECRRQLTFQNNGKLFTVPPKALHGAAYSGGQEYMERFLPGFLIVERVLFKKGKESEKTEFQTAYRYVEMNEWEEAATIWKKIMKHNNYVNSGRACMNMAVYCEAMGLIDEAISWARKAYVEFGIKEAKNYEFELRRLLPDNIS